MELTTSPWIHLLEAYRIDDATRAQAYEVASSPQRQCLKTAIAYHALCGENIQEQHLKQNFIVQGFWQEKHIKPADFVLVLCAENFAAPARLIAATMPALLAHVPVYLIAIGTPAPSLLLTLELLGLEESFAIGADRASNVFESLFQELFEVENREQGRVMLLANSKDDTQSLIFVQAKALGCPTFEDAQKHEITFATDLDEASKELLAFAHAGARLSEKISPDSHTFYSQKSVENTASYTDIWGAGMEACWRYADLEKSFFMHTTFQAGLTER